MSKSPKKKKTTRNPASPQFVQTTPEIYGYNYASGAVPEHLWQEHYGSMVPAPRQEATNVQYPTNYPHQGTTQAPDMGELRLEEASPMPPHGHTVPGYPWQGHPVSQPFSGPNGTSPMRASSPQFMLTENGFVGAHAVAPGAPMSPTTGGGYAQAPSGSVPGHAPGWPPLELGDVGDMGDLGRTRRPRSREVTGEGGFIYEQWSDGAVAVVAGPNISRGAFGVRMTREGNPTEWAAITGEIGTWRQYRRGRSTALVSSIEQAFATVTQATQPRRRRRGGQRSGAAPAAMAPPPVDYPPEEEGLPKWVVPTAIAGGALVLGLVIVSGMKKD